MSLQYTTAVSSTLPEGCNEIHNLTNSRPNVNDLSILAELVVLRLLLRGATTEHDGQNGVQLSAHDG